MNISMRGDNFRKKILASKNQTLPLKKFTNTACTHNFVLCLKMPSYLLAKSQPVGMFMLTGRDQASDSIITGEAAMSPWYLLLYIFVRKYVCMFVM